MPLTPSAKSDIKKIRQKNPDSEYLYPGRSAVGNGYIVAPEEVLAEKLRIVNTVPLSQTVSHRIDHV